MSPLRALRVWRDAGAVALFWAAIAGVGCTRAKPDDDPAPPIPEQLPAGPSCERAPSCGPAGDAVSCCDSPWVPGGTFPMGFSPREVLRPDELQDEDRDHPVTVSGYFLDRFEITWSRLEAYAEQYPGPPAAGSGAHPVVPASGWDPAWDRELPASGEALLAQMRSVSSAAAPSSSADAGSSAPLAPDGDFAADRLNWFVAFAFCIWDGGRLPTEAEWEYAAAGGALNYPYPWGADTTPVAALRMSAAAPVGSHPELRGVFGQDDLAGGVIEWAFDWFSEQYYLEGGQDCVDCANTREELARVVRGAADSDCCGGALPTEYRAAARNSRAPGVLLPGVGGRCARDLPR